MKSVIYCRVSSKEQEETGYSLPAQEKFLRDYADKNGFTVAKVFAVSESAGGKVRRKIFNEMMDYIRKNGISVVVVETTDRLTRNFADVPLIDAWILEDEKNQIHLAKEGCILNKNSKSHEWFMWRVKVATAEYYVKLLSENVKKGQKEKLAQGSLPTKPPLGYKTIGEKGHKAHIIDEIKAPLIRKMFELYSSGNYSLKALANLMYKEGLRNQNGNKVLRSRIHELLSYPFYYGKNRWNGELSDGEHKPLISKELFDVVQVKLTRKIGSPQYKKHLPVFKAKIRCERCDGYITWYTQKGYWYGQHSNYKECPERRNKTIRQEKVEEQLFPYFDKVAPKNERVLKWLEKALKETHAGEIEYYESQRKGLNSRFEKTQQRLEKMYDDKLDGKIPEDFYDRKFKEYTTEKEEVLEKLYKLNNTNTQYYEAGYAIHQLALKSKEIYSSPKATPEDKRLLLSFVFSNLSLKDKQIKANYTYAFEFLAKWMPKLNKILELKQNPIENGALRGINRRLSEPRSPEAIKNFRTSKNTDSTARIASTSADSRRLLRGRDSNAQPHR